MKKIILYILMLGFVTMFIFSGYKIFEYIKNSKENEKIVEKISEYITTNISENNNERDEVNVNFNLLKEKNSDTIGYLKVNGTEVENVVVQAKDNDYYLTHNFEKNNNSAGWIFADYRNKFDGTDKNIIIYGHNMRNNTMFGTLKNILKKEWQENENNKKITFITENESCTYEVFSVYEIQAEDYYTTVYFKDDENFQEFIEKIKSRSKKDFNVNVTNENQILTLSTCANNNKYRVVLHAVKLSKQ